MDEPQQIGFDVFALAQNDIVLNKTGDISMKKFPFAAAILATCTSAAWAQSSVTLYGIVDVGVRMTNNEGTVAKKNESITRVIGGGFSNSRLGVNITEDLGDGLRAIANLEHRLNADNGTQLSTAYPFWMQSWVGLQSTSFGRITIGRQYNVLFDLVTSTYASYPYSPYFDAYKPEIGLSLGSRADNMVKYLIEVGPVRAELQVSAGEGAANGGKTMGGMVRYSANGFSVGAGAQNYELGSGKKVKASTLGGSYRMGAWYFNAGYGINKLDRGLTAADLGVLGGAQLLWGSFGNGGFGYSPAALLAGVDKRTLWTVGAGYQVTPQINLGAHYYEGKQTGPGIAPVITSSAVTAKAKFLTVAANYAFSKRTDAYAEFDTTRLSGPNVSLTGATGTPNGANKRNGYTVGLRHRF